MKKILRRIFIALIVVVLFAAAYAGYFITVRVAPVGAGYKAKMLCSYLFLQKRQLAPILANDLEPFNPLMKLVRVDVDYGKKMVTATAFGFMKRRALYRECLGCTLIPPGWQPEQVKFASACIDPEPPDPEVVPWPTGDFDAEGAFAEVDAAMLEAALDKEFSEPNLEKPRRTRAVVVVYRDKIIGERYAPEFSKDSPMHGWSMTKSITSALIGILAGEGKLDVNAPAPIAEWRKSGDSHNKITIDHLLHMSAGFDFHHDLNPSGQRQQALFGAIDSTAYSVACALEAEPGSRWEYANANPHVLWRIIRDTAGSDEEYLRFPRRALFNKIGMRSAVIEPDPYGNFVGTSFGWATARDWARFGLLYLHDGVWEGERILPEGWVAYTRTPAPAAKYRHYGALFWLNAGANEFVPSMVVTKAEGPNTPPFSRLPEDAYFMMGHDGQVVAIIPSRDMVVVRLGLSRSSETWDYEAFLADVLASIKKAD